MKSYEYKGEKFHISEPKNCRMTVEAKGLTAYIYIHEATGMYREELTGWGLDHATLNAALDGACRRIQEKVKKPSETQRCKEIDEFYKKLEQP